MSLTKFIISTIVSIVFVDGFAIAQDKEPEVKTWEKTEYGVTFSLRQMPPDVVNAFYNGRGFAINQIEPYAQTCVYTVVLRNDGAPGRIHFLRNDWRVTSNNESNQIRTNSSWLKQFKQTNTKPSALIAFRLAQIPEEQEYEPSGDWNQGMLSTNLAIGSQFDITINWDVDNEFYEFSIKEVKCI